MRQDLKKSMIMKGCTSGKCSLIFKCDVLAIALLRIENSTSFLPCITPKSWQKHKFHSYSNTMLISTKFIQKHVALCQFWSKSLKISSNLIIWSEYWSNFFCHFLEFHKNSMVIYSYLTVKVGLPNSDRIPAKNIIKILSFCIRSVNSEKISSFTRF